MPPPSVQGEPRDYLERLKEFAKQKGIKLEHQDAVLMRGALGYCTGGKITLQAGLSAPVEFSTLAHELGHELLHWEGDRIKNSTKTIRETEAEAVAFSVCYAVGLDTNTACSDYIQLYQGNQETLIESLDDIQQAASEIIEAIQEKKRA